MLQYSLLSLCILKLEKTPLLPSERGHDPFNLSSIALLNSYIAYFYLKGSNNRLGDENTLSDKLLKKNCELSISSRGSGPYTCSPLIFLKVLFILS
jgi:hypothetical protein